MTQELSNVLHSMAKVLNALRASPTSVPAYNGMCDGLVWTDEVPPGRLPDQQEVVLRSLFLARTKIIMGESDSSIELFWNQAVQAFPEWPGFATDRCTTCERLNTIVTNGRAQLEAWLESDAIETGDTV